jgi:hypothetical protein
VLTRAQAPTERGDYIVRRAADKPITAARVAANSGPSDPRLSRESFIPNEVRDLAIVEGSHKLSSVINHPMGGPSLALGMTRLLC